jgi:hypothetical protein
MDQVSRSFFQLSLFLDPRLVICDHDTKKIQQIWPQDFTISEDAIIEDISVALNTPIVRAFIDYILFLD